MVTEVREPVNSQEPIKVDTSKMRSIQTYYAMISKSAKAIFHENPKDDENLVPGEGNFVAFSLTPDEKKNPAKLGIEGFFSTSYDPNEENPAPAPDQLPFLGEYEMLLTNVIISLYVCNNQHWVTAENIFKAMRGNDGNTRPSQADLDKITKTVERLSRLRLHIRVENLGKYYDFEDPNGSGDKVRDFDYTSNFFHTSRVRMTYMSGGTFDGWEFHTEPMLYKLVHAVKQIVDYNVGCLRITDENGKSVRDNETRVLIKHYLLRRIEGIKRSTAKNVLNRIKFEDIYDMAGKDTLSKDAKFNIRDYVEQCLNFWVRTGYIKSWEYYRNTQVNGFAGIRIFTSKNKNN